MSKKKKTKTKTKKETPKPHPFDKWFKHKQCKLIKGKHFFCQPHSMSVQLRNAAHKRGVKISVHIQGEILIIKVIR